MPFTLKRIGGFRVGEFIGAGGVSEVYRGTPVEGGEPVALKVLKDPKHSAASVRRFLREGWLLRRFRHPGLPVCHAVVEDPQPCIVLELLRGETLSEYLRRMGPLNASEIIRIATALLEALEYLHQNGVVHRDVKSPNVFLHRDGRVLLMDLGLAIDPGDPVTTTLGDVLGTYAYMAPEQIAGVGVDARSDIYSLGVTLYEAHSGTRPFQAKGTHGYLKAHKAGKAWPLADLARDSPRWLVDLIHQFMARDPSERPTSAGVALALITGKGGIRNELNPAPLVGRNGPRGAIEAILDDGGVVHLVGEIGSGMVRMARLTLQLAADAGFEHIAVRCSRGPGSPGLKTKVLESLRFLWGARGRSDAGVVVSELQRLSAAAPMLLLVEDIHLASSEDIDFLGRVSGEFGALRVVTTSLVPETRLRGRVVSLRPLHRDDVAVLVAGMLGTSSPPDELIALLNRESGGLPAFIVLALRELHSRGSLRLVGSTGDGEPQWLLDPVATQNRANSLRPAVQAILSNLGENSRQVLRLLSVAGESLPLVVVTRALNLDPAGFELAEVLRAGFLAHEIIGDEEWITIRRPALAAVVVEELSAEDLMAFHSCLSRALISLEPGEWRDRRVALYQILSLSQGSDASRVLDLAGDLLLRGEHSRAIELVDHLARLPELDPESSTRAALLRGDALLETGAWDQALSSFGAARQLASSEGLPGWMHQAELGLASVYWEGGDIHRCGLVIEGMHASEMPPSLHPRWVRLRGCCAWYRGDLVEAQRHFDDARTMLSPGSEIHGFESMVDEAALFMEISEQEEAGSLLTRAAQGIDPRVYGRKAARAWFYLSHLRRMEGDLQAALDCARRTEEIGGERELTHVQAMAQVAFAWILLYAGEAQRAVELLRVGRAAGDPRSDAHTRLEYRVALGEARRAIGDRQAALASYDQAAELARRMGRDGANAYCEGMTAVLTADATPLTSSLETLAGLGLHRWRAGLLLAGAEIVGDTVALTAAVEEARRGGDRFLQLRALHAMGGLEAHAEAQALAPLLLERAGELRSKLEALAFFRWAMGPR